MIFLGICIFIGVVTAVVIFAVVSIASDWDDYDEYGPDTKNFWK